MPSSLRVTAWAWLGCAIPALAAWTWLAGASCALAATAPAQSSAAGPPEIRVARSALLTVDATPTDDSVALYIKRVTDRSAVNSDDVNITVDGKVQSFARGADGSYLLSAAELRDKGPHTLEIILSHDGIREILSGPIALPQASPEGSFLSEHRQIGWWILNIGVVLIAAIALSRRKK